MRRKRLLAIVIDYEIILLICAIPFAIYTANSRNEINTEWFIWPVMILSILKDCIFKNASICKKILHLEIVNYENKVPSLITIILRNLTIFIWPLEILLIAMKNKRLGDILFKTSVRPKEIIGRKV